MKITTKNRISSILKICWSRLSFKTQFKIEFLLPFSSSRNTLKIALDIYCGIRFHKVFAWDFKNSKLDSPRHLSFNENYLSNYEWFLPFIRRQISPTMLQLYLKQKPIKCYGNPKEVYLQHSLERASSRGASKNCSIQNSKKVLGKFL